MREEKICLTLVLPDDVETATVVALLRGRALPFTTNVWISDAVPCGPDSAETGPEPDMEELFSDVTEAEANADAGVDDLI